jgi:hypothetical protein
MKAIIDFQFLEIMGIRITSKGNLIQRAVKNAIEQNVKEISNKLFNYFREKEIETTVKYVMETNDKAKMTVYFLMITNIPVTDELLEKEKGLMASTENTIKKLCNMLENIFAKKGIRMKSNYKVYAD